uniref:FBA domain-containing protein n=1 Tax=Parascaris univalens TaxID=6257 RepID=A0A915BMA0_PARUN
MGNSSTSNAVNVVVDTTLSLLGADTSGPGGDNEDIMVYGEPIPPQILAEIFMRIDRKIIVGCICPLVCRRWHNVLSAAGFWIDYMRRRSRTIPPPALRSESLLNMKKVCFKQPFERNLIDNPSGEKNFDGWTVLDNGGDRMIVEKPPLNCSTNLDDEIPLAFVTSYGWGTMRYVIDLWNEGIEAVFLDTYRPPITVSEYFTCRRDCAAVYALQVELIPDGQESRICNNVVPRDYWRNDLPEQQDVITDKSVTQVRRMEQWSNAEWQRVEHTFEDYPIGVRFVVFQHSGKDLQFWAGHYGSKMAKASVIVHFGDGHRRTSTTMNEDVISDKS